MVKALAFIVHQDPETDMLVTVFEEDQIQQLQSFSIRTSGYVALKHFQYILGKLIIVSQKQAMPLMQLSYIISILSPLIVAHSYYAIERFCVFTHLC